MAADDRDALVVLGSIPFFVSAANSSNSFPQSQMPTFLPFIFAIVLIPLDFQVSCVMPDRAKTWATLTRSVPLSRAASRLGSQSTPNCGLAAKQRPAPG